MCFMGLNKKEKNQLEYEVISNNARLKLTRLIRCYVSSASEILNGIIIKQNSIINIARKVRGLGPYVLDSGDDQFFSPEENAWHNGEFELVLYKPNTIELVETLADLIQNNFLEKSLVNEILSCENCSFSLQFNNKGTVEINITPIDSIDDIENDHDHPNIRQLVDRMENALSNEDYPNVLHTSSNIFETLGKIVLGSPRFENKTFAKILDEYKERSNLPDEIIEYMSSIYIKRGKEPLAGHGSTKESKLNRKDAIILVELTKTIKL